MKGWYAKFSKLEFEKKHNVIQALASAISMLLSGAAIVIAVWTFNATFPIQLKERELQQQSLELQRKAQEIADLKDLTEKNNAIERTIIEATEFYELNRIVYPKAECFSPNQVTDREIKARMRNSLRRNPR